MDGAPGWYAVWQHGERAIDVLFGDRSLFGPGDALVELSSNPAVHGFQETVEVLTELGDGTVSGSELAAEIARRTSAQQG